MAVLGIETLASWPERLLHSVSPSRVRIPTTPFMRGGWANLLSHCSVLRLALAYPGRCKVLWLTSMVPVGQGQVTVVLDAGLGMSSLSWNWIGA